METGVEADVEYPKTVERRQKGGKNKEKKKMAQTAVAGSRGQERRVDKGKRTGTRKEKRRESRGGVATGSGWISFRLVSLMSVMRAAGPLLPF